MIVFICNIIEEIQQDQYKGKEKRTMLLRSEIDEESIIDNTNPMITFCLALDNFFTLPKVIYALRKKGIEIIGTA